MSDPAVAHRVIDRAAEGRYELHVDNEIVSTADYHCRDGVMVVTYVHTDPARRGQGMSDRLMRGLLDDLRERALQLEPACWVAAAYVDLHPDDADLLAS